LGGETFFGFFQAENAFAIAAFGGMPLYYEKCGKYCKNFLDKLPNHRYYNVWLAAANSYFSPAVSLD
jgi:hypothetical protein